MKNIVVESLKQLIKERLLLILTIFFMSTVAIIAAVVGLSIHISERQVVTHYSVFGLERFYFDQWLYLLGFVLFILLIGILHSVITVKILITKGRSLAMAFIWLSIGMVLAGLHTAMTVISFGRHY